MELCKRLKIGCKIEEDLAGGKNFSGSYYCKGGVSFSVDASMLVL